MFLSKEKRKPEVLSHATLLMLLPVVQHFVLIALDPGVSAGDAKTRKNACFSTAT